MRHLCTVLTILFLIQTSFTNAAFALTPKPTDFAACASQLSEHLETTESQFIPLRRASAVLAIRPRATLLVRASLDHMVGTFDQLQNLKLTGAGVHAPAEFRFLSDGNFFFVVAGMPGALIDFTEGLPKQFGFLRDPRALSFQVLDTDFLETETMDVSVNETNYPLSFRSPPADRPQRVRIDGILDSLVVVGIARVESLISSRELMAMGEIVVRDSDQRLNDAVAQFSQKLKSGSAFILRARDQVLFNTAAWTALLRLRGELALSLPTANMALRLGLAGCLGTTCSPDFVREVPAPVAKPAAPPESSPPPDFRHAFDALYGSRITDAPKVNAAIPEPAALKVVAAVVPVFLAQTSITPAVERALEVILAEQETVALNQDIYVQRLQRDPQFSLKYRIAELFRGKMRDQLSMDREILKLAGDWAGKTENVADLTDLKSTDEMNKQDLALSTTELEQLLLASQKNTKTITLNLNGKRSAGNPETDVAALVALYKNLANQTGWSVQVTQAPEAGKPQAVLVINGDDASSLLQFETGEHRFFSVDGAIWTRYVEVKMTPAPSSQNETANRNYVRAYGLRYTDIARFAQAKNTDLAQLLLKARAAQTWERLQQLAGF